MELHERKRRAEAVASDEAASTPSRSNPYAGACVACGRAWTCAACIRTASCTACTATGRCGSCRNVHSSMHRESGLQQSSPRRSGGSKQRAGARPPAISMPVDVSAIDLPRSRAGLDCLYRLISSRSADLWSAGGGRWMYAPTSTQLAVEILNVKDQYETPAYIWRHAVRTFHLDRDAHASSLNAVLPAYDSWGHVGPQQGARYWLNPAYGRHCGTIADALGTYVWQRGCSPLLGRRAAPRPAAHGLVA
jgi:hypothetical protein